MSQLLTDERLWWLHLADIIEEVGHYTRHILCLEVTLGVEGSLVRRSEGRGFWVIS